MISELIEREKKLLRRAYSLITITTVGSTSIRDLVEGAVIATFGLLACFLGFLVAEYFDSRASSAILTLGALGYLSVLLYHFISIRELRIAGMPAGGGRKRAKAVVFLFKLAGVLLLLALLEVGLGTGWMLGNAAKAGGSVGLFMTALPALVILAFPLFFWYQLCKYTVIDDFVRRKLNE